MAKEEFDAFLDAMRSDKSLAEAFAAAAADVARNNGFDVDDQDVFERFHDSEPAPRPLPPGGGRRSTMAMGEEGGRMTTMAIGEEGGPRPSPPVRRGGDMTGGIGEDTGRGKPTVTTLAVGEEDKPRDPPSVTLAIGEEDRKKTKPPADDDGGTVTSMALGEEEKRRDPPALPITTKAIGEETRKGPLP